MLDNLGELGEVLTEETRESECDIEWEARAHIAFGRCGTTDRRYVHPKSSYGTAAIAE